MTIINSGIDFYLFLISIGLLSFAGLIVGVALMFLCLVIMESWNKMIELEKDNNEDEEKSKLNN